MLILVRTLNAAFVIAVTDDVYWGLWLLLGLLRLAGELLVYFVEIWDCVVVLRSFVSFYLERVVAILEDLGVAHGTLRVSLDDPLPNADGVVAVSARQLSAGVRLVDDVHLRQTD